MKYTSIGLIFLGLAIALFALIMEVTADYSNIVNLDLLSLRQNYLIVGGILFIAGTILVTKSQRNKSEEKELNNQDRISCPFCAEKIMREAKVCRFCSNEIPITVENKSSHNEIPITVENKSSHSDAPTIEKINDDKYEIVFDGEKYNYAGYKYANLQDATNYAELVKKRKNSE